MSDTPRGPDVGRAFAHPSFIASPDLAAERQIWRGASDELARRFDAAQLLQPGPALVGELRTLVAGSIAAFRRKAAMNGTRGLVDPEGVAPRPAPPIEIVLPTGPTVRVPSGFDPCTLGHVLVVLEGRPC